MTTRAKPLVGVGGTAENREKKGSWPRHRVLTLPDYFQRMLTLSPSAGPHILTQQEVLISHNPSFLFCISSPSQKLVLLRHP